MFLQKMTFPTDDLCCGHPVCHQSFIKFYLQKAEYQPKEENDAPVRPHLSNARRTMVQTVKIEVGATADAICKTRTMIELILNFFGGLDTAEVGIPLGVLFSRQNAVGKMVSDSHIVEAWKGFFEQHSVWVAGEFGFYLLKGNEPCFGCAKQSCKFGSDEYCSRIGRWIGNTLLRTSGIPIPLPLDPVFVRVLTQTVGMFEDITAEEANYEYERIIEGRESQLARMKEGLFYAAELTQGLKGVPVSVLMSWLFCPTSGQRSPL